MADRGTRPVRTEIDTATTGPEDPGPSPEQDAVLGRLGMLEQLARQGEADVLLPRARGELHRLTEGLRALLDEHRPDENGRCPVCPGPVRTRRWPCQVWTTAHSQLIGDEADPAGRTNRTKLNELRKHSGSSSASFAMRPGRRRAREEPEEVPVVATPLVASGRGGPGEWNPDDWDTDQFELPQLRAPHPSEETGEESAEESPATPPVGGHLETDHTRIHRAAVVDREIRWPGPRHRLMP